MEVDCGIVRQMDSIEVQEGTSLYFAQAQPAEKDSQDTPGLLRWVANSLDEMDGIEVIDLRLEQPITKGDNPLIGVVFNALSDEVRNNYSNDYTIHSLTLKCKKDVQLGELLGKLSQCVKESNLSLADVMSISFQSTLDDKSDDSYSITVYYSR